VAALIIDSGKPHGLLNAGAYQQGRNPQEPETLPMVTMVHEHYGTLYRLVNKGVPVSLELEVTNYFEDGDNNAYNVVGEIPGKSKPEEVVILGAHLDSWDLGTGATDNGAGSIAVLEAARILGGLKLGQSRTIRFILFGGEEQGLLGSRAYVVAHKEDMARVSGVFVIDTGTGKVRGIGTEGIKDEIPIFTDILAPLKDLGVQYVNDRVQTGTDHLSFGMAGVPGFAFFQDAIEYRDKTHHTQTDTLDKILPDDLEQGAITMAVMGYSVAELPGMLPRRSRPGGVN
jgi:carboxypeptidase Q